MTADLRAIQGWKTWRVATLEDGDAEVSEQGLTDANGNLTFVDANVINVHPYSAIAIRMFSTDDENDTATVRLNGSMDDQRRTGTGPRHSLWKGQVILSGQQVTVTSSGRPLGDGKWAAGTYMEVDTYDSSSGYNAANAVVIGSAAAGSTSAMLIVPTLGYSILHMRITDMGGSGTEMSNVGALYREIAMGGVV